MGHVSRKGKNRGFWWRNPRKRVHLEDLGIDGSIILSGSSINMTGAQGQLAGSCEKGNEPSVSTKYREFID